MEAIKESQQNKDRIKQLIAFLEALLDDEAIYKDLILGPDGFEFV